MLTLQLFIDSEWHDVAQLDIKHPQQGRESPTQLAWEFDYAINYLDRDDCASVSINYPVNLIGSYHAKPWFSFLDDIIPSGASRRYWVTKLGLQGKPAVEQDYHLLRSGTIAPVGNVRIKESLPELPASSQLRSRRFPAEWIIERDTDFLEYAQQMGAASGGATGAGGEAPKLLLRCNQNNEVWIDTWQEDLSNLDQHYLVKYPRGSRSAIDCDILRAEFHFYHELTSLGVDTIPIHHMRLEEGARYPSLWLPRFDVSYEKGKTQLLGLESIYSIMKKAPGSYLNHFEVIRTLIQKLNLTGIDRTRLVIEWVQRDMLNIAFGNSDNHGRNSAILKRTEGMWLAPVYDFAPMKADPEGIVRTTQWGSPFEEGGWFHWERIALELADVVEAEILLQALKHLAEKLYGLRKRLEQRGVPESILNMPGIGFNFLDQRIEQWQL